MVISLLVMTRRLLNERAQYGLADRGDVFLARGMERGLVLRMLSLNILGVLAAASEAGGGVRGTRMMVGGDGLACFSWAPVPL